MNNCRSTDIISAYEHLAQVTARMREAAAKEDWDHVVALETECASVYARLTKIETGAPFDADHQRRKSELICQLLDDDAQIRERVSGQLTSIWRLIEGQPNVDRLRSAYSAGSAEHG